MTGREYAELLHEAAEFFEAHSDMPVPETCRSLAVLYELSDQNAAKAIDIAKREGFTPQGSFYQRYGDLGTPMRARNSMLHCAQR